MRPRSPPPRPATPRPRSPRSRSARPSAAPPADGGRSRQDVVERRLETRAGLLELAFDVQASRAVLRPELQEVLPALATGLVLELGDRLDAVDLARRRHERLRAVVLDAAAQVLDPEQVARELAQLVVLAIHDQLDDVLQDPVHRVREQLEPGCDGPEPR